MNETLGWSKRGLLTVAAGPLTVAQYVALGETEDGYTELVEGRLTMFPNSSIDHSVASMHLIMQLVGQLPDDLEVIRAVDVNLELAPPDKPGHVRRPDLFVAQRQNTEDGLIKASEIVLVVEILSWSSRDTDTVAKRREYAKAGIPFYWIIDLEEQVSLAPMRLAGESGYQEMPVETGVYEADAPFPLKIQVDRLTY